jgi:hydroxymethylpyrimidine pyrophosphatase-like HAD family hydrolase
MQYLALATDYDGTLAEDGKVRAEVLASLVRLKASGRRLVLVTGRELEELMAAFPRVDVFDRVVAENGALLYTPAALDELGIDHAHVVGVGDAENDHSLLGACGLGVAVANAVPALLRRADLVATGARGHGVIELCDQMLASDLAGVARRAAKVAPAVAR